MIGIQISKPVDLIFIDEAGYEKGGWHKNIQNQPFYSLSGVAIDAQSYLSCEEQFCNDLRNLGLAKQADNLGHGFEIKAKEVARGEGQFKANELLRNSVRDLFLAYPKKIGMPAFVVNFDKANYLKKYGREGENLYSRATKYLLERIKKYLDSNSRLGICVVDHNPHEHNLLTKAWSVLFKKGSTVKFASQFTGDFIERKNEFKNIVEMCFNDSKYSFGLQLADFFASISYQYHKDGKPSGCGWWQTLYRSLYKFEGKTDGWGYKLFPGS